MISAKEKLNSSLIEATRIHWTAPHPGQQPKPKYPRLTITLLFDRRTKKEVKLDICRAFEPFYKNILYFAQRID
jgi:hypothetical protein